MTLGHPSHRVTVEGHSSQRILANGCAGARDGIASSSSLHLVPRTLY
jgi:hypothetical protein